MKHFLRVIAYIFLVSETNSYAQKESVSMDTVYIQTLIDSCKTLYGKLDAEKAITVGQNALSLIEVSYVNSDAKTRRKLTADKASLYRVIGNIYKDIMLDYPKALDYYQRCFKMANAAD